MLVEVRRGDTVESRHRGHIVHVDASGKVAHAVGAPNTEIMLRSTVKPFGVVALIESGAADDLALTPSELAIMCASHTGEDKHVRTLQAIFRRASVTQALLRCGTDGAPGGCTHRRATGARRRDTGCGPPWLLRLPRRFHPHERLRRLVARRLRRPHGTPARWRCARPWPGSSIATLDTLTTATDNCGLLTYEITLLELARAYLMLADPEGPSVDGARAESAPALLRVRDAMMGAPEMVGGTYDHLDTELMRRRPRRLVAKAGADGMRAMGLVAADAPRPAPSPSRSRTATSHAER